MQAAVRDVTAVLGAFAVIVGTACATSNNSGDDGGAGDAGDAEADTCGMVPDSGGLLAEPTFNPPEGMYQTSTGFTVTISFNAPCQTVYYTTDGSTPTAMSMMYTAPIPLAQSTTINAYCSAPCFHDSRIASGFWQLS